MMSTVFSVSVMVMTIISMFYSNMSAFDNSPTGKLCLPLQETFEIFYSRKGKPSFSCFPLHSELCFFQFSSCTRLSGFLFVFLFIKVIYITWLYPVCFCFSCEVNMVYFDHFVENPINLRNIFSFILFYSFPHHLVLLALSSVEPHSIRFYPKSHSSHCSIPYYSMYEAKFPSNNYKFKASHPSLQVYNVFHVRFGSGIVWCKNSTESLKWHGMIPIKPSQIVGWRW